MSDKMIERKRQQMGMSATPNAYPNHTNLQARPNGMSMVNMSTNSRPNGVIGPYANNQLPKPNIQNSASTNLAIVTAQDRNLETFLNLLTFSTTNCQSNTAQTRPQHDNTTSTTATTASTTVPPPPPPTVPTSLTRRILQTQGCSYLDPNVSAVISHAADHFLATVLSQAMACRDLRIQGEDLRKQEYRKDKRERRKRRQVWIDREEAKRKKMEIKEGKWKEDIEKARKLRETDERMLMDGNNSLGSASGGRAGKGKSGSGKRKNASSIGKKKNQTQQANLEKGVISANGDRMIEKTDDTQTIEDELSLDSLELEQLDEDAFYHEDDSELSTSEDDEDEEDDEHRDILLLKDLERPIQAWGMTFMGKFGLTANNLFQDTNVNDPFRNPGEVERGVDKGLDGNSTPAASREVKEGKTATIKNEGKQTSTSTMQNKSTISNMKPGIDGGAKTAIDPKSTSSTSSGRVASGTKSTSKISGLDK